MFLENLIQYENSGSAGKCPKCGSTVTVELFKSSTRDSVQISCDKCDKFEFFTGTTK